MPSVALKHVVECFWTVSWHNEHAHTQENLPDPCVNVVFEGQEATLYGPVKSRFEYRLSGVSCLFSVKFTPAGFTALTGLSAANIVDLQLPLNEHQFRLAWQHESTAEMAARRLFQVLHVAAAEVNCANDFLSKIAVVESALLGISNSKVMHADGHNLNALVEQIQKNDNIRSVKQLQAHTHLSERQIQRLFKHFIGIGAKQVIMKYRMQRVLALLENEKAGGKDGRKGKGKAETDWSAVVDAFCYADQAHFIKEFTHYCGLKPSAYLRSLLP